MQLKRAAGQKTVTPEEIVIFLRENANGVSFFLNATLCFVFVRSFLKSKRGVVDWRKSLACQSAVGLATVFGGTAILRFWVWWTLITDKRGDDFVFLATHYEIPLIAVGVMIVGALCTIRVMSPEKWGTRFWILVGVTSVVLPLIINLLVAWYYGPKSAFPFLARDVMSAIGLKPCDDGTDDFSTKAAASEAEPRRRCIPIRLEQPRAK